MARLRSPGQDGKPGSGVDGTLCFAAIRSTSTSTSRYLCADGRDHSTGPGWAPAVFSSNHTQAYVDEDYAAATSYAEPSAT